MHQSAVYLFLFVFSRGSTHEGLRKQLIVSLGTGRHVGHTGANALIDSHVGHRGAYVLKISLREAMVCPSGRDIEQGNIHLNK